jgi:hypothetical protein
MFKWKRNLFRRFVRDLNHLLAYFALELGSRPPLLVREWVNGLNLASVLRFKGALNAAEVGTVRLVGRPV